MRYLFVSVVAVSILVIAGCPSATTSTDPNATDPNSTDPNATTDLSWLDGRWSATASNLNDTVSGQITISNGQVTEWRGSNGLAMTIVDHPVASATATGAQLAVTVNSSTSGLMYITLLLQKSTGSVVTGTLSTVSFMATPFFGTVTMTRQ